MVLLFVLNLVYHQVMLSVANASIEIIARQVNLRSDTDVLVICVYKPPTFPPVQFIQHLIQIIREIRRQGDRIFIGRDFNMDPSDSRFTALTTEFNLVQVIHEPTHIHGRTLDHLYCHFNNPQTKIITGVLPLPYTDHYLTWVQV